MNLYKKLIHQQDMQYLSLPHIHYLRAKMEYCADLASIQILEEKYPLCSMCQLRGKDRLEQLNRKIRSKLMRNNVTQFQKEFSSKNHMFTLASLFLPFCCLCLHYCGIGGKGWIFLDFCNIYLFVYRKHFRAKKNYSLLLLIFCYYLAFALGLNQRIMVFLRIGIQTLLCYLNYNNSVTSSRLRPDHSMSLLQKTYKPPQIEDMLCSLNVNDPTELENSIKSMNGETNFQNEKVLSIKQTNVVSPFANLQPSKFSFECGLERKIECFALESNPFKSLNSTGSITSFHSSVCSLPENEKIAITCNSKSKDTTSALDKGQSRILLYFLNISLAHLLLSNLIAFIILSHQLYLQLLFVTAIIFSKSSIFLSSKLNWLVCIVPLLYIEYFLHFSARDLFAVNQNRKIFYCIGLLLNFCIGLLSKSFVKS